VLPVVTPEDLIVYKLIAGRPRDFADAEEIARARRVAGTALDWSYVENWCIAWGIEDRLATLRRLLDPAQR
jgi:hypothetical protein